MNKMIKKKTNINSVKHPMTYIKGFEYASDSINFLKALKGLPPLPFLKCKDMKPYMRLFNIVLKVIESNDYNGKRKIKVTKMFICLKLKFFDMIYVFIIYFILYIFLFFK